MKDLDQALADFNKLLDLRPDYGHGYLYRGLALADLGLVNAAKFDIRTADELNPKSSKIKAAHTRISEL